MFDVQTIMGSVFAALNDLLVGQIVGIISRLFGGLLG